MILPSSVTKHGGIPNANDPLTTTPGAQKSLRLPDDLPKSSSG